MAVTYSFAVVDGKNDVVETIIGPAPLLRVYNGAVPANARAALAAQVLLAQGVLPSDWMAASVNGVKNKAGAWSLTGQAGAGAGAAGTFSRIYDGTGTTCHEQGTFTATGGGGDMTIDNNSIANGQTITVSTYQKTGGNIG